MLVAFFYFYKAENWVMYINLKIKIFFLALEII